MTWFTLLVGRRELLVRQRARLVVVALVALVVAVVAGCVPTNFTRSPADKTARSLPVIVLGGFEFSCNQLAGDWDPWINAIRADRAGVSVEHFRFDPCAPVEAAASRLGQRVQELLAITGAPAVQVIAHSQGSLVARWCIRFGTCGGRVDTLVGLAAANHGTIWANVCPLAFWAVAGCSAMTPDGPFQRAINADDETWGTTRYVTASSWCDLTVVPSTSAVLEGAQNHTLTRCVGHTEWKTDPAAIAWGVQTLAGERLALS